MPAAAPSLDELCINTIRSLAVDAVQKANSGHPGLPMGAAAMAYVLWTRHLKHDPRDPQWFDRDRFVLSAGHGSMLLYSLLHLTGYDLPLEELKEFRQLGSKTPGHPEVQHTPGVEMTTGPLGQGFANGVGMAIAEAHLAADVQHRRAPARRPLHLRHRLRRRPDGGHRARGRVARGPPQARASSSTSTTTTTSPSTARRTSPSPRTASRASPPTAGTRSRWRTATTWRPSKGDPRGQDETQRPSIIAVRTMIGYGAPQGRARPRRTANPSARPKQAARENLGWTYADVHGAEGGGEALQGQYKARPRRAQGVGRHPQGLREGRARAVAALR